MNHNVEVLPSKLFEPIRDSVFKIPRKSWKREGVNTVALCSNLAVGTRSFSRDAWEDNGWSGCWGAILKWMADKVDSHHKKSVTRRNVIDGISLNRYVTKETVPSIQWIINATDKTNAFVKQLHAATASRRKENPRILVYSPGKPPHASPLSNLYSSSSGCAFTAWRQQGRPCPCRDRRQSTTFGGMHHQELPMVLLALGSPEILLARKLYRK